MVCVLYGSPSAYDILLATELGTAAADFLANKDFGKLIGITDGAITGIPLSDIADKIKVVDEDCEMLKTARALGICFGD